MVPHAILVVDDDRLLRESLCEMLDDLQQRVRPAANGTSAIASLQEEHFDLVMSDVDMPDFSGFELMARMQAMSYQPGVVLMSARADGLQQAARDAGALELLSKPVGFKTLTAVLDRLWSDSTNQHEK